MTAHTVAHVDELPAGARLRVRIGGRDIVIANVGGRIHAVRNRCPHQGGPLGEGDITHTVEASAETRWEPEATEPFSVIRCPWHGLECDLRTGASPDDPRWRVKVYQVQVNPEGMIEVLL